MFKWVEKKTKNFKWYDFSILKLTVLAFALWLAVVLPAVLGLPTWIYAAVWIIGMVYLVWKMFK